MAIIKTKYNKWLAALKQNISTQQIQTLLQVNSNMLILYWYLGNEILQKQEVEGWGTGVIDQLSTDLQKAFPNHQGYAVRSLKYMRKFAEEYPNLLIVQQAAAQLNQSQLSNKNAIVQQAVAQLESNETAIVQQAAAQIGNVVYYAPNPLLLSIPWGHHMLLIDKIKDINERTWYIQKVINNNWSRAVLQYQIDTDLYTRQVKKRKANNFHLTLPKAQSDLANEILKDTYVLDFISSKEKISERELEQTILTHIEKFLVELGAGFAFVGRQYKAKIGKKERLIDLLFYHLHLHSYVVIELKLGEFDAQHTGQMNTYLNYINKQVKTAVDNPSIGIILCGGKDDVEVEYALENINHPIGVSEYEIKKALPKNLKDKLPSVKQLQNEVKKFLKAKNGKKY